MKDDADNRIKDFFSYPMPPLDWRKKRGRKKIYESSAARVAAYRARKNKSALTVLVGPELLTRLDDFMLARDETKSEVVERALREFFRKR